MDDDGLLTSSSDSDSEEERVRRKRRFHARINFDVGVAAEFLEKFRMTRSQFENFYQIVGQEFWHKTSRNHALTPTQQILTALRWLGSGCQYHGVADMHGMHKSTVLRNVHKFCDVIIDKLFQKVVQWPENSEQCAAHFFEISGMPFVCGAVDGTLINLIGPKENERQFVDRKGNHSINVMMVAGADLKFYYVNAKYPGSVHDARIIRSSTLYDRFETGWRPFPNACLIGDSAYPLRDWLIPFGLRDPDNRVQKRLYDCHTTARQCVECAFGIMKKKFPCLEYLRVEPKLAAQIVMTCAVLHNFCRNNDQTGINLEQYRQKIAGINNPNGLERLTEYFSRI